MKPLNLLLVLFVAVYFAPEARAQVHFTECSRQTGNSAVILVPTSADPQVNGQPLTAGDEVAVITPEGLCAGMMVWENENASLTVWGDDPMTPEKDGFDKDDVLSFRVWQKSTGTEFGAVDGTVSVAYDDSEPFLKADGLYADGGIMAFTSFVVAPEVGTSASSPDSRALALHAAYPNPFNGATTLTVEVPSSTPVVIAAYNALGQRTATILDATLPAGKHEVKWDAGDLPSGLYLIQMRAGDVVKSISAVHAR